MDTGLTQILTTIINTAADLVGEVVPLTALSAELDRQPALVAAEAGQAGRWKREKLVHVYSLYHATT